MVRLVGAGPHATPAQQRDAILLQPRQQPSLGAAQQPPLSQLQHQQQHEVLLPPGTPPPVLGKAGGVGAPLSSVPQHHPHPQRSGWEQGAGSESSLPLSLGARGCGLGGASEGGEVSGLGQGKEKE